ncbi:nuclear transport factor 2 family protein [Rhodococcus opacus]|uniref:nuclear transport factor 2 family protein n=1 Tax=Rhodococcus opacus TaxID=37919 RepID=UPI001C45B0ED|nr:nuclear transport factor 2 family protein [Rhodococcus opacus]MBV6760419.1 nuclear transport factor 2 family protein [Rhodococcus opacus]
MRDDALQYLLDKSDVADVVKSYFLALDRFDWKAVAGFVADEFMLDSDAPGAAAHPVPRDEYMRTLVERNGGFTATIHLNTGHLVTVDGDNAHVVAHMWAAHAVGQEPTDAFWGYGLYDIDLARSADGWKLTRQRITVVGMGGEGSPPDVFARSAARQSSGEGHY